MCFAAPTNKMYINKWVTFSVCTALQLTAALPYTFGLFSEDIKSTFGWDQGELTAFGTALNLGAFAAFIPGFAYDSLKNNRHGPRICLGIAAVECVIGMGLVYAATIGTLRLSFAGILFAGFLFANSNGFMDCVAVSCNVSNWPNDRGSCVGVIKAAVGLCPSVFGVLYLALQLDTASYLLLCLIVPVVAIALATPFVNHVPWIQRCELMPHGIFSTAARFVLSYEVLFIIAIFTAFANVVLDNHPGPGMRGVILLVLLALISSLFLVTIYSGGLYSSQAHATIQVTPRTPLYVRRPPESVLSHALHSEDLNRSFSGDPDGNARTYVVDCANSGDLDEDGEGLGRPLVTPTFRRGNVFSTSAVEEELVPELYYEQPAADLKPWQLFFCSEFYLLLFCCFVSMGAGLALLDNLPQVLNSVAPKAADDDVVIQQKNVKSMLIVTFSISNTMGRIASGYLSEMALHWRGTPRTVFCLIFALLTAGWTGAACITVLNAGAAWTVWALLPITAVAGLTYGAYWTLMATTTSELFGLVNFASNYATVQLAPMVATCVCPTLLFGSLYDVAARAQHPHSTSEDVPCVGPSCFLPAFTIMLGLTVLQVFAAVLLWKRTLWVYEREAQHLKEVGQNIIEQGYEDGDQTM